MTDRASLFPTSCFCPIGAVESEIILSPDVVPLPHPETPNYEQAVADVERENRSLRESHKRQVEAEAERVRAEQARRREQRRRCPMCGPSSPVQTSFTPTTD